MKISKIKYVAILILIGALYFTFAVGSTEENVVTTTNGTGNSEISTSSNETIYSIGEAIQNKKYEITISSVSESKKVGTKYLSSEPAEGGTYVCVDFSYKNISSEPMSSWDFPSLQLLDSNGTKYSADISASSYYATEKDPNRKVLSDLNPGITVKDNDVFEISVNSYSQGEWFLLIDNKIKVKIK